MEISPSALQPLAPFFNIGGDSKRLARDPFPSGLELCTGNPFTLRVQLVGDQSVAHYAAWGSSLLKAIKEQAPTNNPTLLPPSCITKASKQLATCTRLVAANALACALLHPSLTPYKLWVCRYGMKLEGEHFFNSHLKPAYDAMVAEVGEEAATAKWTSSVFDWATQSTLGGQVALVKTSAEQVSHLPFSMRHNHYPLFWCHWWWLWWGHLHIKV